MTKTSYVRLAVLAAIGVAAVFIFLPRNEAPSVAVAVVVMLGTVLVGQLPGPKAYILGHRRGVAVAGWAIAALGLVLAFVLGWNADESRMAPGMALAIGGVVLASLTRPLKAVEDAKALAQAPPVRSSGFQEGLDALARPFRDLRASAVVLGPWLALFVFVPTMVFTPLLLLGDGWVKSAGRGMAVAVLLAIAGTILAMYGALMAAAIQWVRFINDGRPPPLRVPWRSLWSFGWRWIVFGSFSRVPNSLGPWLNAHYPTLPKWASVSLTSLVGLGFLVLISPLGLVLPALALRAKDTSIATAMAGLRRFGRSFYGGALVVLAPLALVSWVIELLPDNANTGMGSALGVVELVVWVLSAALTIPAAMTYLTRVRSAAALETGA
jgi:hypothetical protein